MMSQHSQEYDIAVVGLGPVGCFGALLFAEAGLRVVAFERDKTVYALPRAVNLDGEIIRAFQAIGRGQIVQDLMQKVRPGDRAGFANSKREWLFGQDFVEFGLNGWQPNNMFDQPEFETYLREEVIAHPGITTHIGVEVETVVNESTGARVSFVADDGAAGTATARCGGG